MKIDIILTFLGLYSCEREFTYTLVIKVCLVKFYYFFSLNFDSSNRLFHYNPLPFWNLALKCNCCVRSLMWENMSSNFSLSFCKDPGTPEIEWRVFYSCLFCLNERMILVWSGLQKRYELISSCFLAIVCLC